MATYAIGDVQGCFDELLHLLDKIRFDDRHDQLWFAGDLVNRGPKSLETLRFVKSLGDAAVTVLGNHDLHLIATHLKHRQPRKKDSLTQILEAPDCEELLDWLRCRPLFHSNDDYCMVHAGVPPQWDLAQCKSMAACVENILQGPDYASFFKDMYGNKPDRWSDKLNKTEQARFIVNCFTRMRFCDAKGRLDFHHKGAPGTQTKGLMPWFEVLGRKTAGHNIIFGHWSTLGYYAGHNCYAIDTGCLWGGELTALKLTEPVMRFTVLSEVNKAGA